MSTKKYQGLREIRRVTEWKSGCIYRTAHVHFAWVTIDYKTDDKNMVICPVSTSLTVKLNHKTTRTVDPSTPDVDVVDVDKL
jgi:hypothetical protein